MAACLDLKRIALISVLIVYSKYQCITQNSFGSKIDFTLSPFCQLRDNMLPSLDDWPASNALYTPLLRYMPTICVIDGPWFISWQVAPPIVLKTIRNEAYISLPHKFLR